MGAMKELLFDLADLQEGGVNIKSYEQVLKKAEGRLARYVADVGPDRWPDIAEALGPATAIVTDENGGITKIVALISDLKKAKETAMSAAEAMVDSNPHIAEVLAQVVVEADQSITFLEGVLMAKDNL